MAYENPYTAPTLTGFNSAPPSDDGQRTATNAVRWATHLAKIGTPLRSFAQAISAAVLAAFDLLPTRLNIPAWQLGPTAGELSASVTPTSLGYVPENVKRQGAVGDGVTDDTAALLRAAASSRNLFFPRGTYKLGTELYFDSSSQVSIKGEAGSVIQITGTNRAFNFYGVAGGSSMSLILEDITITGPAAGTVAAQAILLDGVALYWLKNVRVVGDGAATPNITTAIYGDGAQQGEIHGGYIAYCYTGIYMKRSADEGHGTIGSNGCELHGVSLTNAFAQIHFDGVSDSIMVHHNHMIGAVYGVRVTSATPGTRISNNHIEGPSAGPFTGGITLDGSPAPEGIRIDGNVIQGSGPCLLMSAGKGLVIRDNTISGGNVQFDAGVEVECLDGNYAVAGSATTFTNNADKITFKRGNKSAGSAFDWGDMLSPAQITANQNDYNPTGLSKALFLRVSTDASRNITGLAGGWANRELKLFNVGAFDIVLKNGDAASSAANRFEIGADITVGPAEGVTLLYDGAAQLWRCAGRHT